MSAHIFEAPGTQSDTVVISYYPTAGNHVNTGPRYMAEAALTGFDIVGIPRQGSEDTHFNGDMRFNLSPENFDNYWAEQSDKLISDYTFNYDRVIVRGQSTGAFPALSIVKTGVVKATHLVIEDGINLRRGQHGGQRSALTSKLDWAVAKVREARTKPQPVDPAWHKPTSGTANPHALKKFAVETLHWAPLWNSSYSRDSLIEIARGKPELPILACFLGHTATATYQEVQALKNQLALIRIERHNPEQPAADIRFKYLPNAWHSLIEYPEFGAQNLQEAAAMTSPPRE